PRRRVRGSRRPRADRGIVRSWVSFLERSELTTETRRHRASAQHSDTDKSCWTAWLRKRCEFFCGSVTPWWNRLLLEHAGASHFGLDGNALLDGKGLQNLVEGRRVQGISFVVFAQQGRDYRRDGFAGKATGLGFQVSVRLFEFSDALVEFGSRRLGGVLFDRSYDLIDLGVESFLVGVEAAEGPVKSFGHGGKAFGELLNELFGHRVLQ